MPTGNRFGIVRTYDWIVLIRWTQRGLPPSLLGSARALACSMRRLAAMLWEGKVRDGEGAIAGTRGARAPQARPQRSSRSYARV